MRLRLMTYNIHKCIGGVDRRYDPERIRGVIAHCGPDFVLLQEVDHFTRRSNNDRQVDLLGDLLGFRHRTWFPNVRVRSGGEYGNAILSRFPLTDTRNIDLTIPPKKRRSVLHARYRVRLDGRHSRTVHVYNMHLGLAGYERKIQLRKFLASEPLIALHPETPIIIAGDFNDIWGTLGPKILEPAGFRGIAAPLRTFPAWGPVRALDAIYVRGPVDIVTVQRSRTELSRRASDHLPLVAELDIH